MIFKNLSRISIKADAKVTKVVSPLLLQLNVKLLKKNRYMYVDQTAVDYILYTKCILILRNNESLTTLVVKGNHVPSIQNLFAASFPTEREIYEMFGILFINAFDLRRLLCDYSFRGFPLLKKFPMVGTEFINYSRGSIRYHKTILAQSYRVFNTRAGWNRTTWK